MQQISFIILVFSCLSWVYILVEETAFWDVTNIWFENRHSVTGCWSPSPPSSRAPQREVVFIWTSKIPTNSIAHHTSMWTALYKWNSELTQKAFYISRYSEHTVHYSVDMEIRCSNSSHGITQGEMLKRKCIFFFQYKDSFSHSLLSKKADLWKYCKCCTHKVNDNSLIDLYFFYWYKPPLLVLSRLYWYAAASIGTEV